MLLYLIKLIIKNYIIINYIIGFRLIIIYDFTSGVKLLKNDLNWLKKKFILVYKIVVWISFDNLSNKLFKLKIYWKSFFFK